METQNTRNLDYRFIAVPTNLFFALDGNLRNALVVLLQLASLYADANGYFYRTNQDLQKDFKMGKNLTIAVLESLFQFELLQVKSVGFNKNNSTKQVNFYRVNVEKFKDYEEFNTYTITNNKELQLETVNYKQKGFKVTYTSGNTPLSLERGASEELSTQGDKNVSEPKEMPNTEVSEMMAEEIEEMDELCLRTVAENKEDEIEEMMKVVAETEEAKRKAKIEKAVLPTPSNIEYRSISRPSVDVKQRCVELVQRYREMVIPSSNESLDKCNKACEWIKNQYRKGLIDIEDKDHFVREIIQERFRKHRI